ncbi:Ig-like domain-containing protein [Pontibacter virosus]|nr:T9SS type A sorting domain-containing protein [Pontibacter virosus]
MKHIYNPTAALIQRPSANATGTAAASKIFTLLLLSFFLLVSGESVGQETTLYSNGFSSGDDLTLNTNYTGKIGSNRVTGGELVVSGTNGNAGNPGYNTTTVINQAFDFKEGYTYTVSFGARAIGNDGRINILSGATTAIAGNPTNSSNRNLAGEAINVGSTLLSYSVSFTATNIGTARLALQAIGSGNNANLYIDNLTITESCIPLIPQATSVGACSTEPIVFILKASGKLENEIYQWYDMSEVAINGATEAEYTTQPLSQTTTFYVAKINTATNCSSPKVPVVAHVGKLVSPTVNANVDCDARGNQRITYIASGGGSNDIYTWYDINGGIKGTGSEIEMSTEDDSGVHYVVLSNSEGCTSDKKYLVVPTTNNLTPTTPIDITAERCVGGALTINAVPELGMEYRWYDSGGILLGDDDSYTIGSVNSGTTTFTYRKLNSATGCISDPATVTVTGTSAIAATGNIIRPENPIVGQPATFSFESNIQAAEIIYYQWYYHTVGSSADNWVTAANTRDWTISEMRGDIDGVRVVLTLNPQNTACYNNLNNADGTYEINDLTITPLPVELMFFKAHAQTKGVNLAWATASELENKGFEVQVSSNARDFKAIGFVESKVGTTSVRQDYSFLDMKAVSGTRYYRLKQIDLDGTTSYSPIRAVALDADNATVSAYPNPFDDAVIVTLNGSEARNVQIVLMDAMGKVLQQRTEETSGNSITVDMRSVTTKGIYVLHVLDNDTKHTFKLMKR